MPRLALCHEQNAVAPAAEIVGNDVERAVKEPDLTEQRAQNRIADEGAVGEDAPEFIDFLFVGILRAPKDELGEQCHQNMRERAEQQDPQAVFQFLRGEAEARDGMEHQTRHTHLGDECGELL